MANDLYAALLPTVTAAGLELVDVQVRSGVLQVTIDREGGVDLQTLTDTNRSVSTLLDELDPIPGRYSLEVSSPGIERPLRTPVHFAKAIGATVAVKTRPQVPGDRRLRGSLVSSDEEGFELAVDGSDGKPMRLAYRDIDSARTVFVWGGQEAPRGRRNTGTGSGTGDRTSPAANRTARQKTQERKQVGTP